VGRPKINLWTPYSGRELTQSWYLCGMPRSSKAAVKKAPRRKPASVAAEPEPKEEASKWVWVELDPDGDQDQSMKDDILQLALDAPARVRWDSEKTLTTIGSFEVGAGVEVFHKGGWIAGAVLPPLRSYTFEVRGTMTISSHKSLHDVEIDAKSRLYALDGREVVFKSVKDVD
jgi:hypothetical protein